MVETVVFVPGFMADLRVFAPQVETLGRTAPVLCVPPHRAARIEEIASDLMALLPQRIALVGHGLGGMVAMEIARRAPVRVRRIALIGTTPMPEPPAAAAAREEEIVAAKSGRLAEVMAEHVARQGFGDNAAGLRAALTEMATDLGPDVFAAQSRALQRRRDQQATLRKLSPPALILCGSYDRAFPVKRHEFLAEMIPGAGLRVIEGAGHYPMLEAAEAVTEALEDWLDAPV